MRFETNTAPVRLGALASAVEDGSAVLLVGEDMELGAVAPLDVNAPATLSFSNATAERTLAKTTLVPGSVIVAKRGGEPGIPPTKPPKRPQGWPDGVGLVVAANPRRWFIQAVRELFAEAVRPAPGTHRLANVEDGAKVDPSAHIGAFVSVAATAVVGPDCVVETGAVIGERVELSRGVRIGPNTVLGVAGLAVERDVNDRQVHLPHLGGIKVGAHTMIGANSVVVRGSLTDTVIGAGCMIGNHVNIGHNSDMGDECFVGPMTVVCGSVRMGRRCWIAPSVTILNKMRIGENAMVGLGSVVMRPVAKDGYVLGNPAAPRPKINRLNKYNK